MSVEQLESKFRMGQQVRFIDSRFPSRKLRSGVIVGFDPLPEEINPRQSPSVVIDPDDDDGWIHRFEREIVPPSKGEEGGNGSE